MPDDGVEGGGAMLHIGELAARTGLSHATIRHYDQFGLVRPSGRSEGGFRLYTDEDVQRMLLIRRMKPLGFTLDEMKELLDAVDALEQHAPTDAESAVHRERIEAFGREAESRRSRLITQLAMADEFLDRLAALL